MAAVPTVVSGPRRYRGPGAASFRCRPGTWRLRIGCRGPVPPHVPAERLPDGELDPADGARVHPGPGGAPAFVRGGLQLPAARAVGTGTRAPVAGAVPAQRLERREQPAARLALEQAPGALPLPLLLLREER